MFRKEQFEDIVMEHEGDVSLLKRLARGDGRIGLLTLSGVMRGVYGSGAAIALEKHRLANKFAVLAGVSTGAPVALYLAAGTVTAGTRIYYEECTTPDFISFHLKRFRKGNVADMDFLCSVFRGKIGSNAVDVARARECPAHLCFGATNYETGEGVLIQVDAELDPILGINASIAIPLFYRSPVFINGHRYVDGAIGTPFPSEALIEKFNLDGLIVFANRPSFYEADWGWRTTEWATTKLLPRSLRTATRARRQKFDEGLRALKKTRHLIIWSDDLVHSLTRDPVLLQAAAQRAESYMTNLLKCAGI